MPVTNSHVHNHPSPAVSDDGFIEPKCEDNVKRAHKLRHTRFSLSNYRRSKNMVVVWYKLMRALNSSVFAQILAVLKCLCVSDRMIDLCLPAQ